MNAPTEMDPTEVKQTNLRGLVREHRDLDHAIAALEATGTADPFTLRRLKKQKLLLKDRITVLEDEITNGDDAGFDRVGEVEQEDAEGDERQARPNRKRE